MFNFFAMFLFSIVIGVMSYIYNIVVIQNILKNKLNCSVRVFVWKARYVLCNKRTSVLYIKNTPVTTFFFFFFH
jgi:hypothetical protein